MGFKEDKEWEDKMRLIVRGKIGSYFVNIGSWKQDVSEATDLIIDVAKIGNSNKTFASRVRRYGYASRYPYQITIRSTRYSGNETELSKIKKGYGDWMFYGHAGQDKTDIPIWWLIDLNTFRHWNKNKNKNIKWGVGKNYDDATEFVWFDVRTFPAEPKLVIAECVDGLNI